MDEQLKEKLRSPQWRLVIAVVLVLLLMYAWQLVFAPRNQQRHDIGYSRFIEQVEAGNVSSV
jgi:hypothetical protein